jgi:hypothetical protein
VPNPVNLRPGYGLDYVINNHQIVKMNKIEKQYDYLSIIIRPHETPQQWANRVRGALQELLSYLMGKYHPGATRRVIMPSF